MARTQYSEVVTFVDAGVLKPANNARVSVFLPGTSTLVTIYTTRSAGTTKSNPFTTGSDGAAEFWAEWGDFDIKYEDLEVPTRFGTKTFGWSSSSGANGSIPFAAFDAIAARQFVPIGTVLPWYRPADTVAVPTGWAILTGQTLTSGQHDFGTGASAVLPDMRNKFILGANSALADGAAASAGDAAGNAPGIRGAGSSHARSLQHSHTVNGHTHSVSGTSGAGGQHNHAVNVTDAVIGEAIGVAGGSFGFASTYNHGHDGTATDTASNHTHSFSATSDSQTPGTNNQLSTTQDIKPQYVGLLMIMKVKRD